MVDYQSTLMPVPGMPPALGMMRPVSFAQPRACGATYHEATDSGDDMQYCACDTGAIGRCAVDHRPVCGYHSALRDGRRLCDECAAKFDSDAAAAQAEAAMGGLRPQIERVRAACVALSAVQDPVDRFLLVEHLATFATSTMFGRLPDVVKERAVDEVREVLATTARTLIDEQTEPYWNATTKSPALWTLRWHTVVRRWQDLGHLEVRRAELQEIEWVKGRFGRPKRIVTQRTSGWMIQAGNPATSDRYGSSSGSPDLYLLVDGTVGLVAHGTHTLYSRTEPDASHIRGLRQWGALKAAEIPASVVEAFSLAGIRLSD